MRTTIDIERDVLLAAKEIARQRGVTTGKVISDLARQAMTRSAAVTHAGRHTAVPGAGGCRSHHTGIGQPTPR